jgi:xanthine dehydrogenase YagR molybdenum-binding subunit
MAQVAADALGVPIGKVRVVLGDTDLPAAPVHGASRNAGSIGPATKAAAEALVHRFLESTHIMRARQVSTSRYE